MAGVSSRQIMPFSFPLSRAKYLLGFVQEHGFPLRDGDDASKPIQSPCFPYPLSQSKLTLRRRNSTILHPSAENAHLIPLPTHLANTALPWP